VFVVSIEDRPVISLFSSCCYPPFSFSWVSPILELTSERGVQHRNWETGKKMQKISKKETQHHETVATTSFARQMMDREGFWEGEEELD